MTDTHGHVYIIVSPHRIVLSCSASAESITIRYNNLHSFFWDLSLSIDRMGARVAISRRSGEARSHGETGEEGSAYLVEWNTGINGTCIAK
jgi:hypothetical protein